jgi:predicted RNA-binding protein YlxR (DUF448 family)
MERTCVGCRQQSSRAELLRIVEESMILILDERKAMPGRGAWIHPSQECLELAITRRAFIRALKLSGEPDSSRLNFIKEQAETMLANK